MTKYLRKGLALAVCLIMVLGTVLPYAFADSTEQTQTSSVQIGAYKQATDTSNITKTTGSARTGFENEYEKGLVKISKTISGTDTENVFDVTLTVKTGQKIKDTHNENKQAVVLVIDCSGSMGNCICGDKNCKDKDNPKNTTHKSKLYAVKEAVKAFVNEFSRETSITDKKIAVVTFDNTAKAETFEWSAQGWSGKNWLSLNDMNSSRITTMTDRLYANGGTNIEDALIKANQLLSQQEVKDYNKSVILLSDGVPTYHNNENGSGYSGGGSKTEHKDHYKAEVAANALAGDVNKYAIYAGSDNDKISCTSNQGGSHGPGSPGTGTNCDLGSNTTVIQWLSNKCGFTTKGTQDATELVKVFETVAKMIAVKAKAWIVEDPMGSNIDYISFAQGSSSNASYADKKITWNLKHDIPTEDKDNNEFVYTLKYQVKLDTLKMTDFSKFEDVNGNALLKYYMDEYFVDEEGSHEDNSGNLVLSTAYFNIPTVKGFAGTLSFTKTDENGNPLSGATFKLTTEDSSTWNMTATSDKDGKVTFRNIPSGHSYTLKETIAPDGYSLIATEYKVHVNWGEVTVDGVTDLDNFAIKNSTATVTIAGTKTWDDNNNQDGKRPGSITVNLLANGTKVGSKVVTASDEWKYSFTANKYDADGNEIVYSVSEEAVDGYTPTVSGYNITNKHVPETTTVSGTKTWNDNNNQDRIRPGSITVRLYANGSELQSKTVTVNDNWNYSFTNLPKYNNGVPITYTVTEDSVGDYSTEIDGYNITNSYTPGKTSVTVTKAWSDDNNRDGKRTGSVTVKLFADGVDTGKTVTLNAGNNWTAEFTDLDVKKDGSAINYTVVEEEISGYEATITGSADKGYTITNTHTPEKVNGTGKITVEKKWNHGTNQSTPNSVTVKLFADGVDTGKTVILNATSDWKGEFTDLYKYENGSEITYTVKEESVENYGSNTTGDVANGFVITNTYNPPAPTTGSLTITKTTSGGTTPNDAVFTLTNADGATAGTARYSQFVNGSYTFTNLPLGEYTIAETNADVSGYNLTTTYKVGETATATATVTADSTATIAISNVYEAIPPTIPVTPTVKYKDVTVSKVWTDVPADVELPAQVNITLYRNGYVYKTVTLNAQNNWKAEVSVIDDLAIYTVDELAVPVGYEKSIDGLTVTNKYVVEDEPIVDPDDTPTVNPDDGNKPAADVDKDDSNGNKDNNDKNNDKVVKTGDTTGMTMTWGVFAATLLGLGGLLLRRRVHK